MPDTKKQPVLMSGGSSSPGGWFTFIIDFLRSLFRLFVRENRRREADLDEIRKMTNVDYQEDGEMAKSDKAQSKHINPVANGGYWAEPRPTPPAAPVPPLGGAIPLDPVTAGINAVTAVLNFGTAVVNYMAERERTGQVKAMVMFEQSRHNHRLAEIREEFKLLQLRIESDEKKREAVTKYVDEMHRQVEYCRQTLETLRQAPQPDLGQLAAFQQLYMEAMRSYAAVSSALMGA